ACALRSLVCTALAVPRYPRKFLLHCRGRVMALRLGPFIWAIALALGAVPALAQQTPPREPGAMGVRLQDISKAEAEKLGLVNRSAVKVVTVNEGGPAARAGIQEGDVIVSLDGQAIENGQKFVADLTGKGPGAHVSIGILRLGEQRTISVTLGRFT